MTSPSRTLTVVCPVYNEEEVIEAFYDALNRVLDGLADRYRADILFVVDRGTDRTLDILKAIASRDDTVRVLALSARFGHQMALLAGIDHSDADAVVMLDSDLQHLGLIPALLRLRAGHDHLHDSRTHRIPRCSRDGLKVFYNSSIRCRGSPFPGAATTG
jgi:dolichol-phosphate mannosyltransferase